MSRWLKTREALSRLGELKGWREGALMISCFADASLLPLPTSTYFTFISALNTRRAFIYFFLAMCGTLAGSSAGYLIGHFAFNALPAQGGNFNWSIPFVTSEQYNKVLEMYSSYGFSVLLIAAATPIPYAVFSISSGAAGTDFSLFLLGTIAGQGLRFLFLAIAVKKGIQLFKGFIPASLRTTQSLKS